MGKSIAALFRRLGFTNKHPPLESCSRETRKREPAMFVVIATILGMILVVCVAGFVVLMMIHAKVDAYHRLRGDNGPVC